MTDARLRLVVVGVGEITTSAISFDAVVKMADEVERQGPRTPAAFNAVMQRFITNMPRMISGNPPPTQDNKNRYAKGMWYWVFAHPAAGSQLRAAIRTYVRSGKQEKIRITWWVKDLQHPNFVMLMNEFHSTAPNFDQAVARGPNITLH